MEKKCLLHGLGLGEISLARKNQALHILISSGTKDEDGEWID